MPKDAEFNCGVNDGRTPVDQYEGITRGAHGAIDFWGNVWEWTSTVRSDADGVTTLGVKGGSWSSARTDCRTEHRKEGRDASSGYEDVGFRVIQVLKGQEPEQKVELATLDSPVVSAKSTAPGSITISWQSVPKAVEYQLFEYDTDTGLVEMLDTVKGTSITMENLEQGSTHTYIVQPISYVEIADNVSAKNSVTVSCGEAPDAAVAAEVSFDTEANCLTLSWEAMDGVDTYYIYKYHPDGNFLSSAKTVTGQTSYSYRKIDSGTYGYLVATEQINRKGYAGSGVVALLIPEQ